MKGRRQPGGLPSPIVPPNPSDGWEDESPTCGLPPGTPIGLTGVRGPLSLITEGSDENASDISSAFFSLASEGSRPPSAAGFSGLSRSTGGDRAPAPSAPHRGDEADAMEAPELRMLVRAFVEQAVRGRPVEVLRPAPRAGAHPMVFRLSREVDSFELLAPAADASSSSAGRVAVALADVTEVQTAAALSSELLRQLPNLDCRCAVVTLRDGRSVALRLDSKSDAEAFARVLQLLAIELKRGARRA